MGRSSAWAERDSFDGFQREMDSSAVRASEAGLSTGDVQRVQEYWRRAQQRAMIATAVAYKIGDPPNGRLIRPTNSDDAWQEEAWSHYDSNGELHYVATQCGRGVATARLFIAKHDKDGIPREVTSGKAVELSREMLGGDAYRRELLFALGVQGIIAGQSLITVSEDSGWQVFSDRDFDIDQGAIRGGGGSPYRVNQGSQRREGLPENTLTIHLWDRHPGRAWGVDASTRAALPYLRELARLDQYVQSTLLSRIALAGILQVPQEADLAPPQNLPEMPEGADPLMHTLASVGQANISNPGQAGGVLPVIVRMPEGQSLEHVTLDMPLTEEVNAFREINLKRLAYSLDMAPETMSGFSDVKYTNAELIREESIRSHIASRVAAVASALTLGYVRPALGDEYFVQWDLSGLEVQTDRSENAFRLYDRGEIDGDTLRDLTGVRTGSPPEGQELLRQLAYRAITTDPSLIAVLSPLLGERITIPSSVDTRDLNDPTAPKAPVLSPADPREVERSKRPQTQTDVEDVGATVPVTEQPMVSEALVASCDLVVTGALGKAGQVWRKHKTKRKTASRNVESRALYLQYPICEDRPSNMTSREYAAHLFEGRFQGVDRICALYGANEECLQSTLVSFAADLIAERKPYSPELLVDAIQVCVEDAA